ncbi:unnamed protein product [Effrenium voratum]|nr:unnamed protein product [Effrenium voratum]
MKVQMEQGLIEGTRKPSLWAPDFDTFLPASHRVYFPQSWQKFQRPFLGLPSRPLATTFLACATGVPCKMAETEAPAPAKRQRNGETGEEPLPGPAPSGAAPGRPGNVFHALLRRPLGFSEESLFSGTATEGSLDFAWLEGRPRRRQVFDFLHPGEDLVRHYSSLFCRLADAYRWFLPAMVVVNVLQALAELAILHWRLAIGLWSSRVAVLAFTAGSFSIEVALRLWSCIEEHPSLAERPILNRLRFLVKPLNSLDVLTVCLVWASLLLTVRDTQVSHMEVYFRLATALSMAAGGAAKSHSQLLRKDRSDTSLQPEKVLKYNFEADSWNVNVTFKKRRDRNRRSHLREPAPGGRLWL